LEKKNEDLESEIDKLKLELEGSKLVQGQIGQTENQMKEQAAQFDKIVSQHVQDKSKLEKAKLDLERQLSEAQSKLSSASTSKSEEVLQLKSQLDTQMNLIRSLREELDELRAAAEAAEAEEEALANARTPPILLQVFFAEQMKPYAFFR